ncbi:hypothetical protein WA158_000360 [Blastocystis sp. Blastoise]
MELNTYSILFIIGFLISIFFIIFPFKIHIKKHTIPLDYSTIPILVVFILVISGCIPIEVFVRGILGKATPDSMKDIENTSQLIPLTVIALFMSLAYFCMSSEQTGIFQIVGNQLSSIAMKSKYPDLIGLILVFLFSAILTLCTSSDITILTLTPIILEFNKKINSKILVALLITQFTTANTFSTAFLSGNLSNFILTSAFGIDFLSYLKYMFIPSLISGFTVVIYSLFVSFLLKRKILDTLHEPLLSDSSVIVVNTSEIENTKDIQSNTYINDDKDVLSSISADNNKDNNKNNNKDNNNVDNNKDNNNNGITTITTITSTTTITTTTNNNNANNNNNNDNNNNNTIPPPTTDTLTVNTPSQSQSSSSSPSPSISLNGKLSVLFLFLMLLCFFLSSTFKSLWSSFEFWYIAVFFCFLALLKDSILTWTSHSVNIPLILKQLPWSVPCFLLAMFVLVESLQYYHIIQELSNLLINYIIIPILQSTGIYTLLLVMCLLTCFTCCLLNNLPATILLSSILLNKTTQSTLNELLMPITLAVAIGTNIGAIIFPHCALSGIVWSSLIPYKHELHIVWKQGILLCILLSVVFTFLLYCFCC